MEDWEYSKFQILSISVPQRCICALLAFCIVRALNVLRLARFWTDGKHALMSSASLAVTGRYKPTCNISSNKVKATRMEEIVPAIHHMSTPVLLDQPFLQRCHTHCYRSCHSRTSKTNAHWFEIQLRWWLRCVFWPCSISLSLRRNSNNRASRALKLPNVLAVHYNIWISVLIQHYHLQWMNKWYNITWVKQRRLICALQTRVSK